MPIKILHIVDSLGIGGLENGVINLINRTCMSGFVHTICCLRKRGPMMHRITRPNVEVISMESRGRDYLMPFRLKKLIGSRHPDIVHTRNWGTVDGIIGAWMAGVKGIIHGEHGRDLADSAGTNYKRNLFRRILSTKTRCFVTVSRDLAAWLQNTVKVPQKKIITVINGVDTKNFIPASDKAAMKLALGFDPTGPLVGTVGRLDPIKNYRVLIKAMQGIKQRNMKAHCVIIGDGPEKDRLEAMATETPGLVTLAGSQDNVTDYLQAMDIFVLPSLSEGISNTLLEAMASGLAIVTTAVGGNLELIEDRVHGCLVPADSTIELQERIHHLLKEPEERKRLGENARIRCEKEFTLNRMAMEYENLYKRVYDETRF
jgi:sugar transferase (PEP-CTERM/EpsH1 system associated)